jgi:hypothetical protein
MTLAERIERVIAAEGDRLHALPATELRAIAADVRQLKSDYDAACRSIAAMHEQTDHLHEVIGADQKKIRFLKSQMLSAKRKEK